jgi:hypothetical protein
LNTAQLIYYKALGLSLYFLRCVNDYLLFMNYARGQEIYRDGQIRKLFLQYPFLHAQLNDKEKFNLQSPLGSIIEREGHKSLDDLVVIFPEIIMTLLHCVNVKDSLVPFDESSYPLFEKFLSSPNGFVFSSIHTLLKEEISLLPLNKLNTQKEKYERVLHRINLGNRENDLLQYGLPVGSFGDLLIRGIECSDYPEQEFIRLSAKLTGRLHAILWVINDPWLTRWD